MSFFRDLYPRFRWPLADNGDDGFRPRQAGAVHALAAHFAQQASPAIVTMPTGSGKTAVLAAAPFVLRANRVLVLTPSRLLREQMAEDIGQLRVLRKLGVFGKDEPNPKLISVRKRVRSADQWAELQAADVVVAIPGTITPGRSGTPEPPKDLFDLVLVDEAHHAAAATWAELLGHFGAEKQVLFTATPFRRDRRELRGRFVFTYELKDAYRDGVFGRLGFEPVDGAPADIDRLIAVRAEAVYRKDRNAGLNHRIMVRTGSRKRAQEIFDLYKAETSLILETVLGSHSLRHVRKVLSRMETGELDGIICVDMMGEGIDIPSLKVAALHTPHKSLAVTLQFIGRFARTTAANLGKATFIAAASEMEIERQKLYRQGAAWEEIIPSLSQARIAAERHVREVIETFEPDEVAVPEGIGDLKDLSLYTIRPHQHVKILRGGPDVDVLRPIQFPAPYQVVFHRVSDEHRAAIYVTRTVSRPDWTAVDTFDGVAHDLFIIYQHQASGLVFICTSKRLDRLYDHFATSLAPEGTQPLRGLSQKKLNQVLLDLENPRFFNVGKRNAMAANLAVTYETTTGPNAHEDVSKSDSRAYRRGHWFCSAKENGESVTVGLSTASKVWSSNAAPIADLISWCANLAKKISSKRVPKTGTGLDYLSTGEEVTSIPEGIISAGWHRSTFEMPIGIRWKSAVHSGRAQLLDCEIRVDSADDSLIEFTVCGDGFEHHLAFSYKSADLVVARAQNGVEVVVDGGPDDGLALSRWLSDRPPTFYTADFGVLDQFTYYSPQLEAGVVFDKTRIETIDWAACGVDIQLEYGDDEGAGMSVHKFLETELLQEKADLIVYDHGSGEVADFVMVSFEPDHVLARLYHCKASGDAKPGSRVDDLYELCGQVAKSTAWANRIPFLNALQHRLKTRKGRTQIIRGKIEDLEAALMSAPPRRLVLEVVAVQPGLSAEKMSGKVSRVLAAADDFIFSGQTRRLRVLASA